MRNWVIRRCGSAFSIHCNAWGSILIVSVFGASDEWHQSFTPGRSATVADWVADTLGAGLAAAVYAGWAGYRGLLERPMWRIAKEPD